VPDFVVLIMRFHPVGGEDVSVKSEDFRGEHEALEAVARALNERLSLVLRHARYDREAGESGVIINLANVAAQDNLPQSRIPIGFACHCLFGKVVPS